MLGPDDDPIPPAAGSTAPLTSPRGGVEGLWGGAVAGAMLGAFVATLALQFAAAMEDGAVGEGSGWLASWRDWLPCGCIGLGVARLLGWHRDGVRFARGLVVLVVFVVSLDASLAGAVGAGPLVDARALLPVTAGVLGALLGLRGESVRRAGYPGLLGGLTAAVLAAVAVSGLDAPRHGFAVALGLSLLGVVLPVPRAQPAEPTGTPVWLLAAGWLAACTAVVVAAHDVPAAHAATFAGALAVVLAAGAIARVAVGLGAAAALLAFVWLDGPDRPAGVVVARDGDARVVYGRADQELRLELSGELLAIAGPDRCEEPLLVALLHALVRDGDRVLLGGGDTGRVAAAFGAEPRALVEVLAAWPDVAAVRAAAVADGPVRSPDEATADALPRVDQALASLAEGSRQVLAFGALPARRATGHRATVAFQRAVRRVLGDGVALQPIALDRVPADLLVAWLDAAERAHPWNGVYAVGNAAVLVSAARAPVFRCGFERWSDDARWAMHRAHLGSVADLDGALLGRVRRPAAREGAPRDVVAELLRWLAPPDAGSRLRGEGSLLDAWLDRDAGMRRDRARLLTLADDPAGRAEAARVAAQHLPTGARAAFLQAALGLRGTDGVALRTPSLASRCAFAIDPTFFAAPAAVFASLPVPNQPRGELEDLHRVVVGPRLARRCVGEDPLAVALRARFPSACARALVDAFARGPLDVDQALALRELVDPFVLAEVARLALPDARLPELLGLWRVGLPAPDGLLAIARGGAAADRAALARALASRRDPSCHPLIAELMLAEDVALRRLAGTALRAAVGERVPFDPEGPRSQRLDAASRLRELHNRKP